MIPTRRLLAPLLAPPVIALAAATVASHVAAGQVRSPPTALPMLAPAGWVTDAAQVLDRGTTAAITAQLEQLEQDTGHQMVVVTVRSLKGQDIAAFTLRLAKAWGIGRRGINDGVVLLVAPRERWVRIEVGLGLERVLTKARCAAIIQQSMIPQFSRGDLPGGIAAGVAALDRALRGKTIGD